MLAFTLAAISFGVLIPLLHAHREVHLHRDNLAFLAYFSLIGLGFLFLEISQMTRLSTFLGHPVYSLAVILFGLLLSSGLGSLLLPRVEKRMPHWLFFGSFLILCLLISAVTPLALKGFSTYPIVQRMLLALTLIMPLGFFMGCFLPLGMRIAEERRGPLGLFWGLNGAMSVLGSILGMIFLVIFGIQSSFLLGVGCYVLAVLLLLFGIQPGRQALR